MVKFLKSAAFWGAALIGGRWYLEGGVYFDLNVNDAVLIRRLALCGKCPKTEFFLVHIFLYSHWIYENTDQKKLRIWIFFTHRVLIRGNTVFYFPIYILMFMKSRLCEWSNNRFFPTLSTCVTWDNIMYSACSSSPRQFSTAEPLGSLATYSWGIDLYVSVQISMRER